MFGWFKKKKKNTISKSQVKSTSSPSPLKVSNIQYQNSQVANSNDDGFITSAVLGYALNDGIIGGLIGGDIIGGIIGDSLNTNEEKLDQKPLEVSQPDNDSHSSSNYDNSSSYDSISSYDSGSCDSGSCGCD